MPGAERREVLSGLLSWGESMSYRLDPSPNWPAPPGWTPPPGWWLPDPNSPAPPLGWALPESESDDDAASESPTAPIRVTPPGTPPGRPAGRPRHRRRPAGTAAASQSLVQRGRDWFAARPMWARILLILLLLALLPWLLIACGVGFAGVGIIGLLRGSVLRFRVASRPVAAAALLLGLVGIIGGNALAAVVLAPVAPSRTTGPPVAAPASVIPTLAPTTPVQPGGPPTTRPSAAPASTKPATTRSPEPSPSPSVPASTTKPAPLCGAPANPYGYNFCGRGGYVLDPAANVCTYFNCAANFRSGKGHLEECQDGTYTMSGGRPASCVHHGGDLRAVYQGP